MPARAGSVQAIRVVIRILAKSAKRTVGFNADPCGRHDGSACAVRAGRRSRIITPSVRVARHGHQLRSEEHTSELQSRGHLVCRLLLETKNAMTLAVSMHLLSPA